MARNEAREAIRNRVLPPETVTANVAPGTLQQVPAAEVEGAPARAKTLTAEDLDRQGDELKRQAAILRANQTGQMNAGFRGLVESIYNEYSKQFNNETSQALTLAAILRALGVIFGQIEKGNGRGQT